MTVVERIAKLVFQPLLNGQTIPGIDSYQIVKQDDSYMRIKIRYRPDSHWRGRQTYEIFVRCGRER